MSRPLKCPRDGAEARVEGHASRLGEFKLDVCPTCGGVWFDNGEIAKMTLDKELEHLIAAYAGGASDIACPRCGGPVARRPVGEVSVDVCTTCHGVWMDRGELESAARTLGHEGAPDSELDFGKSLHAGDLATLTWMSPRAKEALISSLSRGQVRPP